MSYGALVFSLLFFGAFAVYLFLGVYIIYINPRAGLNRVFFALCVALCIWSLGFAMANSAPTYEDCLRWRRISAVGWGSVYSILLHFVLLLSGKKCIQKHLPLCSIIYLPAGVSLLGYSLLDFARSQYELVRIENGWINLGVQSNLDLFFNIYYISYVVTCLVIVWLWRRKAQNKYSKKQADLVLFSVAAALVIGTVTDVVLSSYLGGPLPQMAPLFTLIPVAAVFYSVRRLELMHVQEVHEELMLKHKTRAKLFLTLSLAFLAGGLLCALAYFLPSLVNSDASRQKMLYASIIMFVLGFSVFLFQFLRAERAKEALILTATLFSIPVITLMFLEYASITVWAFPLIFMTISLVFSKRTPLVLFAVITVLTQLLVWMFAPKASIDMDEIDYLLRIGIILVAFIVGSFVNTTYIKRLRENLEQLEFQKLITDISFDFVSVSQVNLEQKANNLLKNVGLCFGADYTYVYLLNEQKNAVFSAYEWYCEETSKPEAIEEIVLDTEAWWVHQLRQYKLVYIENVEKLPPEAAAEKEIMMQQGIKSTVVVPIEEDGELLGVMGLNSISLNRAWTNQHINLLKILSNLLADGLIKVNSEKEIEYMAYFDHLTGLPNRRLFTDRLTQAIRLALRNGKFVGVMFLDLDSFKMINDTMGHNGGDEILKEVASGLTKRVRKTDTVARFGGDEFLIMLNNINEGNDVQKVATNIIKLFKTPFIIGGQEYFVTSSIGIAVSSFDGEDAATLIKNADIAMYTAKARGKNQYAMCTADMKEHVKKNIRLSNSLYRVQERGELQVFYQPQIKLSTGRITGLEALLRWMHPELGSIPPCTFIPLAEMNGTINSIGDWVLETAVKQNKAWQDMGLPYVRMAVNLSIVQLQNPRFAQKVERILLANGLSPEYLELEITESVATKEADNILSILNDLKQLGATISIDDFGTEYSSLNRLKQLPIDRIKIDMHFIQGIEGSEKDQAITKVIISLAKGLGLEVLAEGVETKPQLEFLNRKMCDEAQGFYYYHPMPAEEIEKLLKESMADKPALKQKG